ncbi:uncharacterized protein LOC34617955 [Cyclospora cayetanensis]|uniref:Uncharacterized protein LOC34617955 n=2 Tax=Cyclospora cayetanensis TaxID=88456 RepID=A0A6P5WCS2_9EIME|nr:uncharacterized protein LOC34617955 [Cyclospora cayetanensis]OEH74922.1 hypothetical protein cyc_00855 [Cyclospora cayetanensis]
MALFSCCNCDPTAEEEIQTQLQPCDDEVHEGSEDMPMTAEQKQKEKERLQALVKSFAKAAVGGAACSFLDLTTQRQIPGRYFLDKTLTNFRLVFSESVQHSFPLKALHEVYSHSALLENKATASLAKEPGLQSLESSVTDSLVMLEYVDSGGSHLNRLFLLEQGGPDGRDRFITCMKVLGLYAKSGSTQNASSS